MYTMSKSIYFDAVVEMSKYGSKNGFNLEKAIQNALFDCETSEERAKLVLANCVGFIRGNNDLKVVLALLYNYMPSKFHYKGNYESMAMLIGAYAFNLINESEFNRTIGFKLL